MDEEGAHVSNGTPNSTNVKIKDLATGRKQITVTLNTDESMAIVEAAHQKKLTLSQYVKEVIENDLIKGGFLPKWWRQRDF